MKFRRSLAARLASVGSLVLFAHCSGTAPGEAPLASIDEDAGHADARSDASIDPPDTIAPPAKANVVFILADDFSWNLVQYMPRLVQMQKDGMTFSKYFVTDSLCCPSRSSILTGKFPHGTGVFSNGGTEGGYAVFKARGNETNTFGTTLESSGYATAFMGKYLNGYDDATGTTVPGWTTWALSSKGYGQFDYTLNENGTAKPYGSLEADYLTDVIATKGASFVAQHAGTKNFLIELSTFSPHSPYKPAPRDANAFPGLGSPRGPSYGARPDNAAPAWLAAIPALDAADEARDDEIFRKRVQSVQSIDALIGKMQAAVAAAGQTQNTYFVFSSDNGFHIGEHSLRAGKQSAFDTDIRVPLVVIGPGIPAGRVSEAVVENIDLCATFSELGQTAPPAGQMGRSLVPLLHGQTPTDWRNAALIEHKKPGFDPNDPDLPGKNSADPPTYDALRTQSTVYVEYITGETEYYDHATDPHELHNAAASLLPARRQTLHQTLDAMKTCSDAASCWAAQHLP